MSLNLTIQRLRFPNNGTISNPITVSLYYKEYYSSSFILIGSGINIGTDGTILESPLPVITIDPTLKYVIKAINELCGFEYEQSVMLSPYCPIGYTLSEDQSICFLVEETDAIPPSGSELAVAVVNDGYNPYGTVIMDPGYNINGTGTFTQISYINSFWVNGIGYPSTTGNVTDGAMNRAGVWSNTVFVGQQLGFSVCVNVPVAGTYYVGIACDDEAYIQIDGTLIVQQNRAALGTYFRANGYPLANNDQMSFNFWYIYPVFLNAGVRVIEMVGVNTQGTVLGNACLACEVYALTAGEIAAATSYIDLGAGLLFSSKDYVGLPLQIGSGGIGFQCPSGYSLQTCSSPYVCTRVLTTPVLY